ncbi:hypothetical protein [Leptospira vanthielii]|uniref:Uncharacterized protein n=1 Tax=Leptospira vanthielii serovar Holland str. Waz Holland = ATCC 700522 TaxID=1218591 RepID=N1W6E4_9LEPT|nr:hypothetical protein [Leptospira vanthielii]EMY71844.1 hypothetical protein LEP1GSC199_3213 [Leptospira vanthielii serovar Holland str. Waz Holland = ATCC 700522]
MKESIFRNLKILLIVSFAVMLMTIQCKKEPEGPTEAEKAEALRAKEEELKRKDSIIAGLKKSNEPINFESIEDNLGGITITNWGSVTIEEVQPFPYFCESSPTNFGIKLYADFTATSQSDYNVPELKGEWKVLSKSKASFDLNDGTGKTFVELTEKPQVLKFSYKYKGEDYVRFHTFCYEENNKFAQEVVIPKLSL